MLIEQQTHHQPATEIGAPLIICPGFHDRSWTEAFLHNVSFPETHPIWLFPTDKYPACSGIHLLEFVQSCMGDDGRQKPGAVSSYSPPILIGFSAGVVGAMQAAWAWQQLGGQIAAILAIDGWGVPLVSEIPCYRLSHDFFTHWSSALLGSGHDSFYAVPEVTHADLWQNPQRVEGRWISRNRDSEPQSSTAAAFIQKIVRRHETLAPVKTME
ncbi:hypothetical protein C1752_05080 [Acaryochloris thomasi RCC1774]|uniref:Uncharacterized protein n=1 Tax=Acaryochloris thomasi RCC1774 TaxID=1764569 RepID=A0A2W1JRB1_9CYAN|nr:hypothetical protein [Acaryochloris thomasi]PZD71671.1 hypothetical protein C1752_05080 [Acaryochloris thomasi RCC1774]